MVKALLKLEEQKERGADPVAELARGHGSDGVDKMLVARIACHGGFFRFGKHTSVATA